MPGGVGRSLNNVLGPKPPFDAHRCREAPSPKAVALSCSEGELVRNRLANRFTERLEEPCIGHQ